ncbi:MAG: M28 family peptidase [Firmicutes bacterium]|nr:M28 family peptidase [Bacillota bacterium]
MNALTKILKKWQTYVIIALIVLATLAGFWNISVDGRVHSHGFCGNRAFEHVYAIAQEPRRFFDLESLEFTREYIMGQLDSFNVENFIVEHTPASGIDVKNIYARIPGTSGVYILLMAHYDTHPSSNSLGVGDNAYAVATLLEIARIFSVKANESPLVNGIKFVFTDAEEIGLHGAIRLVNEREMVTEHNANWILDNVNLVVNIEGRGIRGPLFLFETSDNNRRIINFFARSGRPFGFSFASEIYSILPMRTELGIFLEAGFNGINLSVLDSVEYYHTDLDNLDNICMDALQNYGNTLMPLLIEYTASSRYSRMDSFDSSSDSVFFTILPNIFIRYNNIFSWIIIILLLIGTIVLFILKKVNLKKTLIAFGFWFGFILISAGIGFLVSIVLGLASGVPFSIAGIMSFVAFDRGALVLTSLLICILAFIAVIIKRKTLKLETKHMLWSGIFINLLFLLITAFALHGATFLFLWITILAIGSIAIRHIKHENIGKYISIGFIILLLLFGISLGVTITYSLFVGMTISVLFIILALSAVALTIMVPILYELVRELNSIVNANITYCSGDILSPEP